MTRFILALTLLLCAQFYTVNCRAAAKTADPTACMTMADVKHLQKAMSFVNTLNKDTKTTCLQKVGNKFTKACTWAQDASQAVRNAYALRTAVWVAKRKKSIKRAMENYSDPKHPKWYAPSCQKNINQIVKKFFFIAFRTNCLKFAAQLTKMNKQALAAGKPRVIPTNMTKNISGKVFSMSYICTMFGKKVKSQKKKL